MEIISKVSKGSKMDQIYIPKNRYGFSVGSPVIIKSLEEERIIEKPYFYNINYIEPIKLDIINKIINIIDKNYSYENVIFTGSFLDKGFNFEDIDVLLITESDADIKEKIESTIGIKTHIISIDNKTLIKGLSTDPIYIMMLSKCISRKRFIYDVKTEMNYKLLDLHLLKSKTLIDNFDILNGSEKYYLTRNLISIYIYANSKKISKEIVDNEIKKIFDVGVKEIKENILNKKIFLGKYKDIYGKTFKELIRHIKNGSK
ncbi:MAG: hypothetical protein AABW56_02125 [Nanoarchaeota archaeon]